MFKIFMKEEPFKVVACADGKCIALSDVKDEVFSQKMMGDGFAVIPSSDTIVSPVTGTIETIFPTKHALGIKTKNGIEIILHIGLDTVNLNGEGFIALTKEHARVKAGDALVKIDRELLLEKGYDLSTMVIFTSGYEHEIKLLKEGQQVKAGETLIS